MEQIINNFNNTLLSLGSQLSIICPNSIISNNIGIVKNVINRYPEKTIEQFIIHVLPDKDMIDKENDEYFIKKKYDEINDDNAMNAIMQYKDIWKQLTNKNKQVVISYMKCLCYYAQQYLVMGN